MLDADANDVPTLMAQLGLDDSQAGIEAFVARHRPLDPGVELPDAPFWSESQARLLRETVLADGPLALAVDELDARLRDAPDVPTA